MKKITMVTEISIVVITTAQESVTAPVEETTASEVDCTNMAEGPEETLVYCQDGCDNDGDGFVDCADFSCSQSDDPEVLAGQKASSESSLEKCSDGIDNDSNGYTDCDDYSCNRDGDADAVAYCSESMENTAEKCSDGIDNDNNGYVDCGDFSCSQNDDINVAAGMPGKHYRNGLRC